MQLLAALALAAAGLAGADAALPAAAPVYSRVRSAHFEVLTDAGAPLADHVARRLEALRLVLLELFPPRAAGERRVVVIALASRTRFERLVPSRHAQARRLGGFFQGGGAWDTIVARLSLEAPGPFAAFDHEYAHLVLNRSLPAQPLWVAEGLAELLSDAGLDASEARIGARREDLEQQARGDEIPLASLLRVGYDSPEYLGAASGATLYGRAWALARWTLARHGLTGMRAFLDGVAEGRDATRAFEERLAPLGEAEATLLDVPPGPLLRSARAGGPDGSPFVADAPAPAEVEYRLGELLLRGDEPKRARAHIERALAAAPDHVPARIGLADLHLRSGERAAAQRELEGVLWLSPDDPAALLRMARLRIDEALHEGVALSSAAEDAVVSQLERALARAPGLYEAALLLVELRPQPYASRLAALVPVFEQDPARSEVALAIAALHLKRRDIVAAQRALVRAREAARDSAYLFLLERQLGQLAGYAAVTEEVRGRLIELQCRPDGSLGFTVEAESVVLRLEAASPRSFLVYGKQEGGSGESELVCGPQGRPIVVRYRRSATPTVQGDVVWLSFPESENPPPPRRSTGSARGGDR